MVRSIGDTKNAQWLEPCVGAGALVTQLRRTGIPASRIRGLDLETKTGHVDANARVLRKRDFLQWALTTKERFDRIVANPPYVALRRLDPRLRENALKIPQPSGDLIPATANCWMAFLCAGLRLLKPGGALCFVLPAAWEYADYARSLRDKLPALFGEIQIHRCKIPLFDSVQEGAVVLVAKEFQSRDSRIKRAQYDTPQKLIAGLSRFRKSGSKRPARKHAVAKSGTRLLAEIMDIRLGGVTGDADYFLLTEAERKYHRLPVASMRPVVSKSTHLQESEIDLKAWNALRESGARIWLFRPGGATLKMPDVVAYLNVGKNRLHGYKMSSRPCWHTTPLPRQCDGFLSGMTTAGPWLCLRTMPRLSASNTLYVVSFRRRTTLAERAAWALSLLTSSAREQLQTVSRRYAAGLPKWEPGDLNKIRIPVMGKSAGVRRFLRAATVEFLRGYPEKASEIADTWFRSNGQV
jgi:adenine-specific DNA-methyltransferase